MKRLLAALAVALVVGVACGRRPRPATRTHRSTTSTSGTCRSLWAAGARGQGVRIAEIDTGVDASLPEFTGRVAAGVDFGRLGGDGRTDRDQDPYGHGTSMASIMVGRPGTVRHPGRRAGRARSCRSRSRCAGTTDAQPDDRLPEAIRWAADHGAKIISMSLGGVRHTGRQHRVPGRRAAGDLPRPAQGRDPVRGERQPRRGRRRGRGAGRVPGRRVGRRGRPDGTVAPFSSRHPYLTMTAPGVDIASIGPGGAPFTGDGTSQATAIASAVAALVWSKYPTLTGDPGGRPADRHPRRPHAPAGPGLRLRPAGRRTRRCAPTCRRTRPTRSRPSCGRSSTSTRRCPEPVRAPAPISHGSHPPGTFTVGAAPRLFQPRVLVAAGVAAAGLVLVLALAVGAWAGRRRRRFATVSVTPLGDDQPGGRRSTTRCVLRRDPPRRPDPTAPHCRDQLADSGRFLTRSAS